MASRDAEEPTPKGGVIPQRMATGPRCRECVSQDFLRICVIAQDQVGDALNLGAEVSQEMLKNAVSACP